MTKEEKDLLLKDLSARLPYGVICDCLHDYHTKASAVDAEDFTVYYPYCDEWESIEYCKPYLRPMSSMTLEELEEYRRFGDHIRDAECKIHIANYNQIDWLNRNNFDYRGLIPKGCALEAPEGMYK